MVKFRGFAALIVTTAALFSPLPVAANTVGLWLFDTMTDATSAVAGGTGDPPGGETLFDSSGNGLNFVSESQFGSMLLDQDVPSVMGANTYSLEAIQLGNRLPKTPSSSLFHRGNTGELTIEFWFNYLRPSPSIGYIASFDGGTPSTDVGNWDLYGDGNGDIRFSAFSTKPGFGHVEVKTDFTSGFDAADGNWHHLAFTADSVGTLTSYFDGIQVQQSAIGAAGTAASAMADTVNLGFWKTTAAFANHDFLIDELRISDTALLPGTGTGVGQLAWNAHLGTVPPVLPPRGPAFTNQWLRSRDFTISAWDSTTSYGLYTAAGFNAVLGGGPEAIAAGVEDHYLGAFTHLDNTSRTAIQIALNQGVSAFLLKDEIPAADIPGIGDVAAYIRSVDNNALLIAGLGSSSPGYVDQVITTIHPDAVVHGFYSFQGTTGATDAWGDGLADVALVRERTLFHNVAYFAYVQTFGDLLTGPNSIDDNRRLPTESEFRADVFSKLSAGVKGFVDYKFQNGAFEDFALVNPNGVTSSLYAPVAAANDEISNLGKSLLHLTSTDWRFVSGGVSATPAIISAWDASAGNGLIDAIAIGGPSQNLKDALVGYFADDLSGEYFMLANTFHGDNLDAAAAAVHFTITFDGSVNSVWRLNRLTGLVEELVLAGNVLSLTLPGGTGDLFKFRDGHFAGLASLSGDYNGNGIVDAADYTVWRDALGQSVQIGTGADGSGDGWIDQADYDIWKTNFGSSVGAGNGASIDVATAPEPTTAFLLVLGISLWVVGGANKGTRRGIVRKED